MSWSIDLQYNSLKLNEAAINALFEYRAENYDDDMDYVVDEDGYIMFNSDDMEHMDFLWDHAVQDIITLNSCSGTVIFSSSEGDNKGKFWGYVFTPELIDVLDKKQCLKFMADNEDSPHTGE
jgi:hypothetical protein